jgi:hypothetical protein
LEIPDEEYEIYRSKIYLCFSCIRIGPDAPAKYEIPKGHLDPIKQDRLHPIVTDDEIPKIWEKYSKDLKECAKNANKKREDDVI